MVKVLHNMVRMLVSVLIAKLVGSLFRKAWRATAHEDDVPKATDARRGWGEVLLAAALQGMIMAVAKAAVERGTAEGTHRLTGVWPGENGDQAEGHQESA